jgi:hypothetical protein
LFSSDDVTFVAHSRGRSVSSTGSISATIEGRS